ncbi:hypothetical protein G4G28_18560 [Massilia sp. Dwa41.01b]|uniref:hypothetical protein n=1 Tax=unclassified Massilia TaxID=2609279 RepID=UPI001601A677|nr:MULTISPECIES: hypothetical protein [unclassified Massilia]QNA90002.1 hypothetical protein G4G28_18560 [Massilia sp. Dwa41.01b]QNB00887.1 hypothetical protein G4G31_22140 [Massilia sp. Se16.2.3]
MTTLSKLEELADDKSQPSATRRIAGALASAINDWPTFELDSFEAYVLELKKEIGGVLTWTDVMPSSIATHARTTRGKLSRFAGFLRLGISLIEKWFLMNSSVEWGWTPESASVRFGRKRTLTEKNGG